MTTNPCPYCGDDIQPEPHEIAHEAMRRARALAKHKATCSQKRYLGGTLTSGSGTESMDTNESTDEFLTELATEVERVIHNLSPNEWYYNNAMLFGVDDSPTSLSLPQLHGDIYELLGSPLCASITSAYKRIALLTCGWAAPIAGNDGVAPSQAPDRQRCRLVIFVDKESRTVINMLRRRDNHEQVDITDSAHGPLQQAVLQAIERVL